MSEENLELVKKIERKKPIHLSELRIPPISRPQSRDVINKMLEEATWNKLMQTTLETLKTNKQSTRRLDIYKILMKNTDLIMSLLTYQYFLLERSSIEARNRELLILRIAWLSGSDYMWFQHKIIGHGIAGLSEEEIERVKEGPDAEGWGNLEATIFRAVDELHVDAFISDPSWKALSKFYNNTQLMDMLCLASFYFGVAMILKSLGVQPEGGWKFYPE
jgi:alkylhydroperoxidase family enzyme